MLERWIRGHTGTAYHWMCTCRAGGSVVDEKFKVRGIEGLRIGETLKFFIIGQ